MVKIERSSIKVAVGTIKMTFKFLITETFRITLVPVCIFKLMHNKPLGTRGKKFSKPFHINKIYTRIFVSEEYDLVY